MAPCPSVLRASGETATVRAGAAVEKSLDLAVPDHAIEQAGPAGAVARPEHGSHQRKGAGGLHEQPGGPVRHPLPVQFGQPPFEIIVGQRDRQVGGPVDDADAEIAQGAR